MNPVEYTPAHKRKPGSQSKLPACFCDRDKAVVLGDIEYSRIASLDREQGGVRRCVDMQWSRPSTGSMLFVSPSANGVS